MKKDDYISISEFAERAGVSKAYIYKALKDRLQPYLKEVDSQKRLNIKALELFDSTNVSTISTNDSTDKDTLKELIEILQEQQETLKAELDIKNEQIRALNTANSQQLQLIDQQQKLQAIAEQKRLQITEKPKQESLLNPDKFKTRTEYGEYLRRLLPHIGMFSGRADKQELLKVLELMSEDERNLVNENPHTKEAIEMLKNRDIEQFEKDMKEAEKESAEMRNKWNESMEQMRAENERKRAEQEARNLD